MNLIEAFQGIPTGNIADNQGFRGVMDAGIQPLDRHMTVVGRALTCACAAGDNLTIHKAVLLAKPGDVLVVSCGGYLNAGVFGEMLAVSCRAKGIAGIIIDGSCRDSLELIEMNFPTYVRGVNPNGTIKETCGAVGGKVLCGGVWVEDGDIIVGDADGVVVVKAAEAEEVQKKASAKKAKEDILRPQFAAGKTTAELLGLMDKITL